MNADAERNGILHGPEITTDKMYVEGEPRGWWRMPRPASLPHWLDENDFQYYVSEFKGLGFKVGFLVCLYKSRDLDWTLTKHLEDKKVPGPVLFVAGCEDVVLTWSGGKTKVRACSMTNAFLRRSTYSWKIVVIGFNKKHLKK